MAIPKLYYSKSIENVDTDEIEGDAIVLVDAKSPDKFAVHFVRNHRWFKPKRQRKPSVIEIQKEKLLKMLERKTSAERNQLIMKLGYENNFPYIHTFICLPPGEPTIEILDKDNEAISLLDNLHPVVSDYLMRKNEAQANLIPFLQNMGSSPDAMEYCKIYRKMPEEGYKKISLHLLIDILRKRIQIEFITYDEFKTKANKIVSRFKHSQWTKKKIEVFDDFEKFCEANCNKKLDNLNYLPRTLLVERWANNYMKTHEGQNPFVILGQHRREGLSSIFDAGSTASMKLFHSFLEGEKVTDSLRNIMRGYTSADVETQKNIKNKKPGSSSEI